MPGLAGEIVRAVNFYNYNQPGPGAEGAVSLRRRLRASRRCGRPLRDHRLEVHPATDLLPEQQRPEEEPWLYLRAIAGVFESFRGGKR